MAYSLSPEELEQIRRSIVLLSPHQPAGLDREAAAALLGELQRLQGKDRRIQGLLAEVAGLLDAARTDDDADAGG